MHYKLTSKDKQYIDKRIGSLTKYIQSGQEEISVTINYDKSGREDNNYVCEAVIKAGKQVFQAKFASSNVGAAVDEVCAKLRIQIVNWHKLNRPGKFARIRRGLKGFRNPTE